MFFFITAIFITVFNFANVNISWLQLNIQFVKLIHVYKICNIICNENFPFDQFLQISSFNGSYSYKLKIVIL